MTHKSGGRLQAARLSILLLVCAASLAAQTVYPTGTTIYDPARAWSGYTVLSPLNTPAVIVIDMNGNVVKQWDGFVNSAGGPARVFPGGFVMAANGSNPPRQESLELVQRDFDGKILSRFDRNLQIQTRDGKTIWSARQHHDWQREDYPAGYYSPEANPSIQGGGNTLVLTHVNHDKPAIADAPLEDDRLSSRSRRRARSRGNGSRATTSRNSASPRRPVGDQGRVAGLESKELRAIRQIVGQHHPHIIPKCRTAGFRNSRGRPSTPSCHRRSAASGCRERSELTLATCRRVAPGSRWRCGRSA